MDYKKLYITASIPYVNAAPHAGYALELTQVDAIARAYKSQGLEVRAQFGTDENSLKNVQAAEKANEDINAFVTRHAEEFKRLAAELNCEFDDFIRTREDRHIKGAQKLWSMCKPEDIYKKSYSGLYCVGCEAFYTEKEVPDSICPTHKKPLETVEEENYFFKLSNYQDQIFTLLESGTVNVFPENRRNEMLSFVKQGLEDFSISRSQERAKHWGVTVPGDESQVMYVWFDALSNYITALGLTDDAAEYKKFWTSNDSRRMHVIGKDIVRFHGIYWVGMLLSAGIPLPTDIYIHGFFTVEGEKMSKSTGNVIDPFELIRDYGIDATRYILLREMPYADDGDLSKARMEVRYAELANQLGNLVSRVAAMSVKYFEGNLDEVELSDKTVATRCKELIAVANLKGYIDTVFEAVAEANDLVDKKEPFRLVKTDEAAAKAVLSELRVRILLIAELLAPIIPESAAKITEHYRGQVTVTEPLFPRRDQKEV